MPEDSTNSTQNQIEQRLAELPQDVRDAMLSAQLGENLRAIGQKHGLHIDQVGVLEDETMLVMLGFFEPEDFNNQLIAQLRISPADAEAITQEVTQQVFLPIRESMKAFTESKRKIMSEPAQVRPIGSVEPRPDLAPASATVGATSTNIPIRIETPQQNPVAPPQAASEGSAQAKPTMPPMPNAEKMLTQTTVTKPIYKTDPYREPIEP
ncbi:hypothetical protein K2Q00_01540 [Patescibacteria group bacterium]|nr:hypothetical protein [Patescibacteria group bacterium]